MKKFLICTTFRDFNGNENAQIQELLLDSLRKQTYPHWQLIVTTFNEAHVADFLKTWEGPVKVYQNPSKEYRFSLTKVVQNTIKEIEGPGKNILIWTTCDVIFEPNFLQSILDQDVPYISGTSHPHHIFQSQTDYLARREPTVTPTLGLDTLFFDADLFLKPEVSHIMKTYPNINWGCFELFLSGIAELYSLKRVNLYTQTKISKIQNIRPLNNETTDYFEASMSHNWPIFQRFVKDYHLTPRKQEMIPYIMTYRPTNPIAYYLRFHRDYGRYWLQKLKRGWYHLMEVAYKRILVK